MKRTVTREQYFTRPSLAARCVSYADGLLGLDAFDRIVEPSAGAGAFVEQLPADRCTALDVEPRHPAVAPADFLCWHPPHPGERVLTIGNPPFGQRGAMAVAFLDHACAFSDAVAFILPRSFNKYTFQNRVDTRFHLAGGFDCEEFASLDGDDRPVRATFQVWVRHAERRQKVVLPATHPDFALRHAHLSRVSADELAALRRDHAFAIAQVGADFAPRDVRAVTRGSHWFVRPHVAGVRQRFERLDFGFLAGKNTAHTSLSKRDIVAAYEQVLAGERDTEGG